MNCVSPKLWCYIRHNKYGDPFNMAFANSQGHDRGVYQPDDAAVHWMITPQFRDLKNGQYKMISFFAKKARGVMARYIIQRGLNEPEALKRFKVDGYYYSSEHSEGNNWVFLRDAPPQG